MNEFLNIIKDINYKNIVIDLNKNGFTTLGRLKSTSLLSSAIREIDNLSTFNDVEKNYSDSEHRIWNAHNKMSIAREFKLFSDKIISNVLNKNSNAYDILAIRNKSLNDLDKKNVSLRWHMDSFFSQLKTFLFISEVHLDNGPFEIISKTHKMSFKLRLAFKANFFKIKNLKDGKRGYTSIDQKTISSVIDTNRKIQTMSVPAGTLLLANTSCLHRAKPCIDGSRYALTSYYN